MDKYEISVSFSEEDDCYVACSSVFPSLMTHGDSEDEAIDEMIKLIELIEESS